MKAYPGRAQKFESPECLYDAAASIYLTQPLVYQAWHRGPHDHPLQYPHHLYHGKRGHAAEGDHRHLVRQNQFPDYQEYPANNCGDWRDEQDMLQVLGQETVSIFKEAFQNNSSPRKKSKLSVTFAERFSQLVQKDRSSPSPVSGTTLDCVAEVHQPSRPGTRQRQALSRRQILASLEDYGSSPSSQSSYSWSSSTSSPSPKNSENSFSESTSTGEGVFSRACLLQSISREESASPRFGGARLKLDSAGESDRYESHSEASEEESDAILDWEEDAKSAFSESSETSSHQDQDSDSDSQDEEFSPSSVTLDSLSWVATLGVGGYGRVELVTSGKNKIPFAMKKMKKNEIQDPKQQQHILHEKSIMQSCSSPFIVQLYKTFQDSKYLYMLMEPCLGGELWTVLRNSKRFTDSTARFYVACVILAFDYLHAKGVIYRDLKPENLLLDSSGYIKLTDFGFAKQLDADERAWTFCGTPEYVAPEIITNKSHDHHADIWSIGILVYELLTGAPPFTKKANSAQVYPEILKGMRGVHFPSCISASASEIIRQCCRLSPSQRPSLNILKHFIWFAGFDWVRLAERNLPPPTIPRISSDVDSSNFDSYKLDMEEPEDDFSEWAETF